MPSALSIIPPRVMLIEDMQSFIHYNIKELGAEAIRKEYNSMCVDGILKDEHKDL